MNRLIFNKQYETVHGAEYNWNGFAKDRCASGLMNYFGFIPNKIILAFKNPKEKGWKAARVELRGSDEICMLSGGHCTMMCDEAMMSEFKTNLKNNTVWIKGAK